MTTPVNIYADVGAAPATSKASGGLAPVVGPRELLTFAKANIAAGDNADPALATPVAIPHCGVATIPAGVTMQRPGYLMGFSVKMSAAAHGSSIIYGVYKNGAIINAATIITVTAASGLTTGILTATAGMFKFAAGDVLDVRVRTGSGWDVLTTDVNVLVEVEFYS
jgi:hypothetical protein